MMNMMVNDVRKDSGQVKSARPTKISLICSIKLIKCCWSGRFNLTDKTLTVSLESDEKTFDGYMGTDRSKMLNENVE